MRRLLIIPTAAAVLLTTTAPVAIAADGGIVHRQSVLTEVDAEGSTGTSRIFTQMTVPSGQEVSLLGQSTSGLRTLSGAASSQGDDVVFGDGLGRTVADHTGELPVDLAITYSIDGRTVEPRDVVGHDGEVAVTYVVRNLTAEPTEVTVIDGDRVGSKETIDVAVPFVGSLSMTLPPQFSDVDAPGAVVVGDGRGNTVVNWSLLLFSPLGSETQEVTWTADARDAIVPEALLQVIPVSPASFGSFGSTTDAYKGAVDSTRELTAGAREINLNLQRLADGAGRLLAGLTQLADGSTQLAEGLVAARDGSGDLSDGLGQARDGGQQLSSGLGELSSGASRIADGLAALDAGAAQLGGGLGQLADGSSELADGVGQLAAGTSLLDENTITLAAGAAELAAGAALLEEGLETLEAALLTPGEGIDKIKAGVPRLQGGLSNPACLVDTAPSDLSNPCGIKQLNDKALALNASVAGGIAASLGQLQAITTSSAMSGDDQTRLATAVGTLVAIQPAAAGVTAYANGTTTVGGRLDLGLSNPACDKTDPSDPLNPCGLLQGLEILEAAVAAGLGSATTPDTLLNGAARVAGGSAALADGAGRLQTEGTAPIAAGAARAAAGAEQLAAGAALADAGAGTLTDGSGQLADGSVALAAGAKRAATGSSDLVDGLVQLDDGGQQLASGLVDAADGSQQLADGLQSAASGGEQIAGGSQRLIDEGTSVMADSVSDAAASSSRQLAHVRAVAARGTDGDGLPYPTVEGADASAVYKFELAGVGADAGPGVTGQIGLGALALLAAALLGSFAGGRSGGRGSRLEDDVIHVDPLATV
ncbi:MAG: putative membrane protein [Nitriliruptoraceae bacterium]|jgi:putative membrane protein